MQKNKLFLLIVPIVYIIAVTFFRSKFQFVYNFTFDPSYAYLFNGLNLAQGKIALGHVDHPGTPVQVLIAIILRIVHFTRHDAPLVEDVLSNPELYLRWINNVFIGLNTLALLFLGNVALKSSSKLSSAILIQSTPFISKYAIMFSPFIMVEPILLLTGTILLSQLIIILYNSKETYSYKRLIIISVIIGFGIACKINFVPVLIVPFIIFKGIIRKVASLIISIITFIICAAPALMQNNNFFNWVARLITRSGKYGLGQKKFMDFEEFFSNLAIILERNPLLMISLAIFTAYIGWRLYCKKKFSIPEKLLAGIISLGLIQLFIVGKHFALHYLLPVEIFLLLGGIVLIDKTGLNEIIPRKAANYIKYTVVAIIIINCFVQFKLIPFGPSDKSRFLCDKLSEKPTTTQLFVLSPGAGIPNVEGALHFGKVYSGKLKNLYAEELERLYPNTYFFMENTREFFNWAGMARAKDILGNVDTLTVNFMRSKAMHTTNWTQHLSTTFDWDTVCKNRLTFIDLDSTYHIGQCIPDKTNSLFKAESLAYALKSSFEHSTSKNMILTSDSSCFLKSASLRVKEKTRTGKYALELDHHKPYAISLELPIIPNSFYKMSIWQYASGHNGVLIANSKQHPEFYLGGEVVVKREGDWQQIALNFTAPNYPSTDSLFLYLKHNNEEKAVFDDFKIEVWK